MTEIMIIRYVGIEGCGTGDFQVRDVEIGNGVIVHTVILQAISLSASELSQPPIVLLHGTGGGAACYHKLCAKLFRYRVVYAIDIPGFGLSSRLKFPADPERCEAQLLDIIEQWRMKMKLEKMVLVGHSLGGYISAIYAIKHFSKVRRLILIDSWGVVPKREEVNAKSQGLLYNMATTFCEKLKSNPLGGFSLLPTSIGRY